MDSHIPSHPKGRLLFRVGPRSPQCRRL
uniref:Uncharacterized protein n=1 Tax=Arundo donax TaxID=35708 RepID=A0A0A9FNM7_ARUDO